MVAGLRSLASKHRTPAEAVKRALGWALRTQWPQGYPCRVRERGLKILNEGRGTSRTNADEDQAARRVTLRLIARHYPHAPQNENWTAVL
jgi:hypothetical protein